MRTPAIPTCCGGGVYGALVEQHHSGHQEVRRSGGGVGQHLLLKQLHHAAVQCLVTLSLLPALVARGRAGRTEQA